MQSNAAEKLTPLDHESLDAESLLRWAGAEFGNEAGFASSFSPEDVVIIDILAQIDSPLKIFALDTGRLHEETYRVMDAIREKYGVTIDVYFPDQQKVENMVRAKGPFSFYESLENRRECCTIRKVEPLKRALSGLRAWVTGLRREQSVTRSDLLKVDLDPSNYFIHKINPLLDWSDSDVWTYIRDHRVPYNTLFDQGFKSVGCAPCTRAVKITDEGRIGRWWWEQPDSKECGLH